MNSYSLLYVASGDSSINAGKLRTDGEKFAAYLGNAQFLAVGLEKAGASLTIISNEPDYLALLFEQKFKLRPRFSITSINFLSEVPEGSSFYSAHFKLDAIRHLIERPDFQPFIFLDLDMIVLRPSAWSKQCAIFTNSIGRGNAGLLTYDISEQVYPAYGRAVIARDIEVLTGKGSTEDPPWMGGEFLCVLEQNAGLRLLSKVAEVWPRYLANWKTLHHVGDESVMSAAMNLLVHEELGPSDINDATSPLILKRFWSGRIRHSQTNWLSVVRNTLVLHLPQEKKCITTLFTIFGRRLPTFYGAAVTLILAWIGWRRVAVCLVGLLRK